MRFGLDFGTTHSSIAYYDGDMLHPVIVEPNSDLLPSLIYITRGGDMQVGTLAAEAYLREETGRPVLWRWHDGPEIATVTASLDAEPIQFLQATRLLVDTAANGRLLQSIKAGLFNARYTGTKIFDRFYLLEELIAPILRKLKDAAEVQFGTPCESVVLGRPVKFADQALTDSRAESILLKAAHLAGLRDVVFEREPVGVAHLYHRRAADRQTVFVFDFGGGTLDMTVAEVGGKQAPRILATSGVHVGGDDLDRRIMESLLPHFGAGDDGALPPEMTDKLLSWPLMPELSRPHHLERIRQLQGSDSSGVYHALETLVTQNLGYKLFKEIERVKKALSTETTERLMFEHGDIHINELVSRRRFERLIAPEIDAVNAGIDAALSQAGLTVDAIDVVLRTGGSSLVPIFYQLLVDRFGVDKQRAINPLTSVVGGFAVRACEVQPRLFRQIIHDGGRIEIGARCYTDRDYVVNRIASPLNGLSYIQTSYQDRNADISFTLDVPARVYVAYDSAATQLPAWLESFTLEPMQIDIVDDFALIEHTLRVYGRDFPAGVVTLGGAGDAAVNYLVLAEPR